jgi:hypothetical protein
MKGAEREREGDPRAVTHTCTFAHLGVGHGDLRGPPQLRAHTHISLYLYINTYDIDSANTRARAEHVRIN